MLRDAGMHAACCCCMQRTCCGKGPACLGWQPSRLSISLNQYLGPEGHINCRPANVNTCTRCCTHQVNCHRLVARGWSISSHCFDLSPAGEAYLARTRKFPLAIASLMTIHTPLAVHCGTPPAWAERCHRHPVLQFAPDASEGPACMGHGVYVVNASDYKTPNDKYCDIKIPRSIASKDAQQERYACRHAAEWLANPHTAN